MLEPSDGLHYRVIIFLTVNFRVINIQSSAVGRGTVGPGRKS